ncbi:MAG: 7-cyano-7-deazaguanine synthase QueC [Ignavibacteriae bacterium]|nr:7-cyano-7-deazaguanine synthase QueC [Ignavibacteriota bacterium]
MSRNDLAVVLASGGMDSCVTIAIAAQAHELALVHFNYGQRTERRELQAFEAIADHFHVARRLVISIEHLAAIGGSSLTDTSMKVASANLKSKEIPTSYVPFRNANMLSAAVSWAEVIAASSIFVGAVEEDSSGYPDCRREFYDAFEKAIDAGTKPSTSIRIITPLIHQTKMEIVQRGLALGAPLHLTWSCYQNDDVACGVCDSCALRLRGFQMAGVEDPIPYVQRPMIFAKKEPRRKF